MDTDNRNSIIDSGIMPIQLAIIFGLVYLGIFITLKDGLFSSVIIQNMKFLDLIKSYGAYAGFVFGILAMIKIYILIIISRIFFLGKFNITKSVIYFIVFGGLFCLGFWLVYFEPRNTDIGIGIIEFIGRPLMYSSFVLAILSFIFVFVRFFKKIENE